MLSHGLPQTKNPLDKHALLCLLQFLVICCYNFSSTLLFCRRAACEGAELLLIYPCLHGERSRFVLASNCCEFMPCQIQGAVAEGDAVFSPIACPPSCWVLGSRCRCSWRASEARGESPSPPLSQQKELPGRVCVAVEGKLIQADKRSLRALRNDGLYCWLHKC